MPAAEQQARDRFAQTTADHRIRVFHDDGVYRHLRFSAPKTWMYGYDLITWPGCLAIEGDICDGLTFSRVRDMFTFFRGRPGINPGYWAEKITNQHAREATRTYSEDMLHAAVADRLSGDYTGRPEPELAAIRKAWAEHIEFLDIAIEEVAQIALRDFEGPHGFDFGPDWWEIELRTWNPNFLRVCWAIKGGIELYDHRGEGE